METSKWCLFVKRNPVRKAKTGPYQYAGSKLDTQGGGVSLSPIVITTENKYTFSTLRHKTWEAV